MRVPVCVCVGGGGGACVYSFGRGCPAVWTQIMDFLLIVVCKSPRMSDW